MIILRQRFVSHLGGTGLAIGLFGAGFASDLSAQDEEGDPGLPKTAHMIDTHIHLYDTTRAKKVTWPPEDDEVLYKPHLPAEFTKVSRAAGVTGVVIVEASERLEDNRWVLDLVKGDPYFVALVGNIDPSRKDFGEQLEKLAKDKRFVGIRARNEGPIDYTDKRVLSNFRLLAKRKLSLDILANGKGVPGVKEVDKLARAVPEVTIIVDHVLGFDIDGKAPNAEWIDAARSLAENKNVYCKVSGLYQRCLQQPAPKDLKHYKPVLDPLWKFFGSERLVYGSNWPCTKKSGDYASYARLVNSYFSGKGKEASENYFWRNAARAYRLDLK
jgi:L-fuconolactonase